jgi:hypothetical protein
MEFTIWSIGNTHEFTITYFQSRFSFKIWCVVIGSQVIELFVLEERLTYETDEMPLLLDDPSHIGRELWLQQHGPFPHYGRHFTAFLNQYNELSGRVRLLGHQGHLTSLRLLYLRTYEFAGVCSEDH